MSVGPIAAALKHMLAAGMADDAIVQAVAEMEAAASAAPPRTARQERNRRYYERVASEKRLKASEQDVSDAKRLIQTPPRARVEDITSNLEIEPQEKKDTGRSRDLSDFKAELSELDGARLEAVLKLRRTKKGQITGHAARLFKADAQACGLTLAEAVDTCVSRNWITVKADWLAKPNARGSPGSPAPKSVQALTRAIVTEMKAADDRHNSNDGSHRPFVVALPGSRFGTG